MSKKSYVYSASIVAMAVPLVAGAAGNQTLATLIDVITGYLNKILFLMMGLAVVIFVWYIIKYFIRPDTEKKEAGQYVMYSLIGFFIILSFWGLVNILQNTFGLQNETNRPSSWTSFTNLFPGGGSSGNSYTSPNFNQGGNYNPGSVNPYQPIYNPN